MAFSVLNQSIDLDYLTAAIHSPARGTAGGYDDIDSITELVLEQLMDDDDYVPDADDDHDGMPKNKGVEKSSWNPYCCPFSVKSTALTSFNVDKSSHRANQQTFPTCKGYFHIVTPPPDQLIG